MGDHTRRAVLVYVPRSDGSSLMIDRIKDKNDFLFETIVAPGGGIKYGERPVEAACRELLEESGLTANVVAYRGTVLFDRSGRTQDEERDLNYSIKINHSVDVFCADKCFGVPFNERSPPKESEKGPLIWVPNSEIAGRSGWNGGDDVLGWLRDGRLFDAVIRHGENGENVSNVRWTGRGVSHNPYWDV